MAEKQQIVFRRIKRGGRVRVVPIRKRKGPKLLSDRDKKKINSAAILGSAGLGTAILGGFAAAQTEKLSRRVQVGTLTKLRRTLRSPPTGSRSFVPNLAKKFQRGNKISKAIFKLRNPIFLTAALGSAALLSRSSRELSDVVNKEKEFEDQIQKEGISTAFAAAGPIVAGAIFLRTRGVKPLSKAFKESFRQLAPRLKKFRDIRPPEKLRF